MDLLAQMTRLPFAIGLWSRFPVGSLKNRVLYGIFPYPHYAYGVYWSACLASRLGLPRMSAIELGVAGGRGLLALQAASREIGAALGVEIDVVGFDTGAGMPEPHDYRDLPHIWAEGNYQMEPERLKARLLPSTRLVLGNIAETAAEWLKTADRAPLGFVAFDLDYYSSTKAALRLLEGSPATHLPRVHCYFDDIASNDVSCMNEYVGELLAIKEFNGAHADRKIARMEQLRLSRTRWEKWQDRMFAFHNFAHAAYTRHVLPGDAEFTPQLPLPPDVR